MRRALVVACLVGAALVGFGAGGAPVAGAAGPAVSDWRSGVTSLRGQNGSQFAVVCPAGGSVGSVWGTDTYTDDSSVCTAAVHAGLVSLTAGGSATIEIRPSLTAYTGSVRNGVTSRDYGAWHGSFVFVGAKPAGTVTTNTATTAGVTAGGSGWAADTRPYRGKVGARYSYACPAGGRASTVWGTNVYTDDSSVCNAAVHMGLISMAAGGTVTIEVRPGLSAYTGSTRNGIRTRGYGAWSGSYVFAGAATTTTTATGVAAGGSGWAADTRPYRSKIGARYSYVCPAGGRASTVWGTNAYTDDSSVCNAAVHMGLISMGTGGTVTVEVRPGLSAYTGSTRNGITTRGYGAWHGTFVFVR